eukprot:253296-Prymnesium_polylepis.1
MAHHTACLQDCTPLPHAVGWLGLDWVAWIGLVGVGQIDAMLTRSVEHTQSSAEARIVSDPPPLRTRAGS